jgi:hypothetical protein
MSESSAETLACAYIIEVAMALVPTGQQTSLRPEESTEPVHEKLISLLSDQSKLPTGSDDCQLEVMMNDEF